MNFLLTAFDLHLFEPIVSSTLLEEVERTLIEDFPNLAPGGLRRRVDHMRAALADQTVETWIVEGVPETINAKDRHLIAAALGAEATIVVTNDNDPRSSGAWLIPCPTPVAIARRTQGGYGVVSVVKWRWDGERTAVQCAPAGGDREADRG